MLFFVHIARRRWLFWDSKYGTNTYSMAAARGGCVCCTGLNFWLSTRKKKQPIVNEFPVKNQRAHCNGGGGVQQ